MYGGAVQPAQEPAVPRAERAAQDHHVRGVQRGRSVPGHRRVRPLAQRARVGPPRPARPGRATGGRVPWPQVRHQLRGEYSGWHAPRLVCWIDVFPVSFIYLFLFCHPFIYFLFYRRFPPATNM